MIFNEIHIQSFFTKTNTHEAVNKFLGFGFFFWDSASFSYIFPVQQ